MLTFDFDCDVIAMSSRLVVCLPNDHTSAGECAIVWNSYRTDNKIISVAAIRCSRDIGD